VFEYIYFSVEFISYIDDMGATMNLIRVPSFEKKEVFENSEAAIKRLRSIPKNTSELLEVYGANALDGISPETRGDILRLFDGVRGVAALWLSLNRHTLDVTRRIPEFADALEIWGNSVIAVIKGLKGSDGYHRIDDLTEEQISLFDTGLLSDENRDQFRSMAGTVEYLKESIVASKYMVDNINLEIRMLRDDMDRNVQPVLDRLLGGRDKQSLERFAELEKAKSKYSSETDKILEEESKSLWESAARHRDELSHTYFEVLEKINSALEIIKNSRLAGYEAYIKEQNLVSGGLEVVWRNCFGLYADLNYLSGHVSGFGSQIKAVEALWLDSLAFIESSETKMSSITDNRSLRVFVVDVKGVMSDWRTVKADAQAVLGYF
jgi:hypothetical protein